MKVGQKAENRRCLVTGGTGYLGGAMVREFLADGWQVRCLVRPASDRSALPDGVEVATGDVTDPGSLGPAMADVQLVCHSAALVASWVRDRSLFERVNVGGTVNVFRAALERAVPRVLYTSTFFALGPTDDVETADEEHAQLDRRFYTDYERSKTGALARVEGFVRRGLPVVTVMPGVIFGPGKATGGSLVNSLIDQAARGTLVPLVGTGRQRWCFAYVKDVARGHLLAAERGGAGERYLLGGENVALEDFFAMVGESAGRPWTLKTAPTWIGKLMTVPQFLRAWLGGRAPEFTPGGIETLVHSWAFSSEKARRELGYHITPIRTALQETLAWLKDIGREGV